MAFDGGAFESLAFDVDTVSLSGFVLPVEDGATLTYAWSTVVRGMWGGKETRASLIRTPRQRFEFNVTLTDAQFREILTQLQSTAASAALYELDLAHEDLGVVSSTSASIAVEDLSLCDWAVDGQLVAVISSDGSRTTTTIDGTPVGDVIATADDVSAYATTGARIMPIVLVHLDPDQDLTRNRVGRGTWKIEAIAAENGYGATTQWGVGATVTTHDSMPVWDRGNAIPVADQPLLSGTSPLDAGLAVSAIAMRSLPFWKRGIRIESSDLPEWQWFKAFLMAVRGRHTAFLLPTGRPDLVAESDASTGVLTISGADYAGVWATSTAHRRIRIVFTDGTSAYRNVTSSVDNGDGTQDLTLNSSAAGAIERIELLETVRLEEDDVSVSFMGWAFESTLNARVVQLTADSAPTTFDDYETSTQLGKPRELYTFQIGADEYKLTSSKEDEEYAGDTYTATPGLSRGNVTESPLGDTRALTVTLPITHPIAADLIANGIPPKTATVTVVRFHEDGDSYRVWLGGIAEISTEDQYANLRVPSLLELAFDIKLPSFKASRMCQHALYGPGCQVVRPGTGFTLVVTGQVLVISGNQITLDAISEPDGWYDGGEITAPDGTSRTILEHAGTVLLVDVPFRDLDVLDTVEIRAGCDKQATTCRDKFDNIVNFGGHPDLPEVNPTTAQPPKGRSLWDVLKGGG